MKRGIHLLLCCLLLAGALTAQQTERFIEISLTDTVEMEANDLVVLATTETQETGNFSTSNKKKNSPAFFVRFVALVKKLGTDTIPQTELQNTLVEGQWPAQTAFLGLRFKNTAEYRGFREMIAGLSEGIQFRVVGKTFNHEADAYKRLYAKMLAAARQQAEYIAGNSKLTGILQVSVTDEPSGETTGWTIYPPLSALQQNVFSDITDHIIIRKKITVRFGW
ncbi:MAG: hypothetical protein JNM68_03105 [Dinghuibacter sp.]|nr:hypothetical protein [Dinghuibacter sp.]